MKKTIRRYAYRYDPLYYKSLKGGPGLVFQSGPFKDRYFWTRKGLMRAVHKIKAKHPDAEIHLYERTWGQLRQ